MSYEDEIYHSGYLDGYYDSMELYHSDEEMTEEERKARRRRRRRNIALGVAGAAGAGAAGYAIARGLRKRGRGIVPSGSPGSNAPNGLRLAGSNAPTGPRLTGPSASNGLRLPGPNGQSGSFGPRPTGPRLTGPSASNGLRLPGPKTRAHRKRAADAISNYTPKYNKRRRKLANPGSYRFDPNKDFGGFLTLESF